MQSTSKDHLQKPKRMHGPRRQIFLNFQFLLNEKFVVCKGTRLLLVVCAPSCRWLNCIHNTFDSSFQGGWHTLVPWGNFFVRVLPLLHNVPHAYCSCMNYQLYYTYFGNDKSKDKLSCDSLFLYRDWHHHWHHLLATHVQQWIITTVFSAFQRLSPFHIMLRPLPRHHAILLLHSHGPVHHENKAQG